MDSTNDNGELTFIVQNYTPTDLSNFDKQSIKGVIGSISFKDLNWQEFERLLGSYTLSSIRPFLDQATINSTHINAGNSRQERHESNFFIAPERIEILQAREEFFEEEFQVSYEETRFRNGYVEFLWKFKWALNSFTVKIENPNIREEFEVIKDYFAKAINNKKKYSVKLKAKLIGFDVVEYTATSEDLEKINANLIESIRVTTTKRLFSEHKEKSSNKKVLSVEEIFENLDEYPNVFNQSDVDIFSILAEAYGLRNKLPLEYLSGQVHSTKLKVKFTLKPMFGFLFFIEGDNRDFFCWELLNSNATYLWMIPKNTVDFMQAEVEGEISAIHELGREQYRKLVKETPPKYMKFFFIDHRGIKNEDEGFVEWKRRLVEIVNYPKLVPQTGEAGPLPMSRADSCLNSPPSF